MAYQGWANWETWNVALWINNDEGLYTAARSEVRRTGRKLLARDAEAIVRKLMPAGTPDMEKRQTAANVYRGVRWGEIAASLDELR
jgi:hypothetical protein